MPIIYIETVPMRTSKKEIIDWVASVGDADVRRIGRVECQGGRAVLEVPDGWEVRLPKALDGRVFGSQRVRVWGGPPPDQDSGAVHSWGAGVPLPQDAIQTHFARLRQLLKLESHAQADRVMEQGRRLSATEAERAGIALIDLVIVDENAGLGGRSLVTLTKRSRTPLPWTRLGVGSPVLLSPESAKMSDAARGVIFQRQEKEISIALNRRPDDLDDHSAWRLDLSDDEVAVERQRLALERVRTSRGDRLAHLRDVILGLRSPEFGPELDEPPLDASLNEPQREAVDLAMAARDVALIHGPPGTGKTTAVVEVVRRAVRRGEKVLVCAPSNLAVDNLFERLLAAGERAVRLGHPARVLPELRAHTLDLLVEEHPDVRVAHRLIKEARALFRRADRFTRKAPEPGQRREQREEARLLLADARRLEFHAAEEILNQADILCATTTGLDSEILGTRRFQLAVLDEACQSVEPGSWIPLLRCERVVMAGDHCQLPPTVISQEAAQQGFGVSLFEQLMNRFGDSASRALTIQYRMHRDIMTFSSEEFYDGRLEANASVEKHVLADLPDVAADAMTQTPVEFIDTAGAGFDEELEPDGESRLNRREADLACRKVKSLLDCGVQPSQIAVIAPYAAQVRLLREKLDVPGLEVDSVDGFQGREKEAVVISCVRSNSAGEVGFLADVRRMNVAITRARRKLIVLGDSATLSSHPFYGRLLEYFERIGAYRTVWEEGGFDG